jgi:hypothetical protein
LVHSQLDSALLFPATESRDNIFSVKAAKQDQIINGHCPKPNKDSSATDVRRIPRLRDHIRKRVSLDESAPVVVPLCPPDQHLCPKNAESTTDVKEETNGCNRNSSRFGHTPISPNALNKPCVNPLHYPTGGWPIQARFWLEWGSSTAGRSLPAARSRFRVVHFDSISFLPHSRLLVVDQPPTSHSSQNRA